MSAEEVINRYLDLEKRTYTRLMNGEIDMLEPNDPMLLKTHIKSRIDLLENLKEEIIGE